MKRLMAMVLGILVLVPAHAQADAAIIDSSIAVQQQRLDALRQQTLQQGQEEERACEERFAVNDCLKAAQARNRRKMADIRRQQESLHDLQRKQRGDAQSRRQDEKKLEHAQKLRDATTNQDTATGTVPVREQGDAHDPQSRTAQSGKPLESSREKERTAVEGGTASNRQAYQRKLQDAELKRQERDKRLKEKAGSKPALPLPSAP